MVGEPVPVAPTTLVAFADGTHGPPVPQDLGKVTVVVQVAVEAAQWEDQEEDQAEAACSTEEMLSSTGQTVVETATTEVTTTVDSAGHAVTQDGQLVTVLVCVSYRVDVVNFAGALTVPDGQVDGQEEELPAATAPTRTEAAAKRILIDLI